MDYEFVGGVVVRNLFIGYFVKAAFDFARNYEPPTSADWRTRVQGYLFWGLFCAAVAGIGVLLFGYLSPNVEMRPLRNV